MCFVVVVCCQVVDLFPVFYLPVCGLVREVSLHVFCSLGQRVVNRSPYLSFVCIVGIYRWQTRNVKFPAFIF